MVIAVFITLSILFISPAIRIPRSEYRSSQLKQVVTDYGNVTRTDYVDSNGRIIIAADVGFATKIVSKTEDGEFEEYLDDHGEPISRYSGYFKIYREYDDAGYLIRITYMNLKDEPVIISDGYAIEERVYDNNHMRAVYYLDASGTPVLTISGYGKAYEYNVDDKISKITCLDSSGQSMIASFGYASVTRNYYKTTGQDNGKVESEFYFDEGGSPIALSLGQYGVHKEYDENGKEALITYLDADGNPIITNKGYTTIRRTYQSNNAIATEQYYDINGKPFAIGEGQYGYKIVNGRVNYLDQNGHVMFNIRTLLYNHSWIVIPGVILLIGYSCVMGRKSNAVLFILYLSVIAYLTLMFRETGDSKANLNIFYSYRRIFVDSEMRADIIRNIWLFIPLGTIVYRLFTKYRFLVVPALFSCIIELIQFITGTGLCEIDDVISNGIGGAIGYGAGILLCPAIVVLKEKTLRNRGYKGVTDRNGNIRNLLLIRNVSELKGESNGNYNYGLKGKLFNGKSISKRDFYSTWATICKAISASLLKKTITIDNDVNWPEVFMESKKQAVLSLVKDGVAKYLPSSLATEWKFHSIQEISFAIQLLEEQKELESILDKHMIHHMILKGSSASIYYPEPYFRSMGDVDFWVPEESFNIALEILRKAGYMEIEDSDERHLKFRRNNILFEMHRHFSTPEVNKKIDNYIENAELVRGCIRDSEFWMLPDLENGLVLLTHLCQHLYEGIGLRHVLDWMMYCNHTLDEEGWEKFRPHAQELGLEKLALVATRLCVNYFGLDVTWTDSSDDDTADMLMASIFQSGNFGKAMGAGRTIEKLAIKIRKHGLFSYLQKAGEFNLKDTLSTYPYLRPFAWLYQVFRYLRQARRSGHTGGILKDDLKRSNKRYELLKALELL